MDPVTLSAIISAIPQVFKMGSGMIQNRQANEAMDSNVRPTYSIPKEMTQSLDLIKMMQAMTEMPGQSLLEGKLDAQFANQTQDIKDVSVSSADALNSIVNAGGRQQMVMADVATQAASRKDDMTKLLMSTLGNMAQYRDKSWEINKLQPYLDKANTASALKQGGMTNLYGGLEGLSRAAGGYMTAKSLLGEDVSTGGDGSVPALPDGSDPNAVVAQSTQASAQPTLTTQQLLNIIFGFNGGGNTQQQQQSALPDMTQIMNALSFGSNPQ